MLCFLLYKLFTGLWEVLAVGGVQVVDECLFCGYLFDGDGMVDGVEEELVVKKCVSAQYCVYNLFMDGLDDRGNIICSTF